MPANFNSVFAPLQDSELCQRLANWLPEQRWFAGKSKRIERVSISDLVRLPTRDAGEPYGLAFVDVLFADGVHDLYLIPLELTELRESLSPRFWWDLLQALFIEGVELPTLAGGVMRATRAAAFDPQVIARLGQQALQVHGGQQSNTSVSVGEAYFLKLFRRPAVGANPDVEIGRFLTERSQTAYQNTPALVGTIELQAATGEQRCLAILSNRLSAEGDAWTYSLQALGQFWQRLLRTQPEVATPPTIDWRFGAWRLGGDRSELPAVARELVAGFIDDASLLGRRTGELHVALASDATSADFAPEPLSSATLSQLIDGIREEITTTEQLLRDRREVVERHHAQTLAAEFGRRAHELLDSLTSSGLSPQCDLIRVHGDYHLGQVLRTADDFHIIDFEGEPDRPLAERRQKRPVFKDVAGMIRSFHYASNAGAVGLIDGLDELPPSIDLRAWQQFWFATTARAFLGAYRTVTIDTRLLPSDSGEAQRLLDVFILEKAMYELRYELNNRPDWALIPLIGLSDVLERATPPYIAGALNRR